MTYDYKTKYDLFSNGNYIASFDSLEEIDRELHERYNLDLNKDYVIENMNKYKFSVIESKHIIFRKQKEN